MSKLFTEDFFRQYNSTSLNESQKRELRYFSLKASHVADERFDIFLSYNISDKLVVEGIYYYLSSLGYKVYLDSKIDPDLNRNNVTKETAERIRKRLNNSRSLIFAASQGAALSKWMTWELGVVDGHTSKCMLLPVSKGYETVYNKQEYLKLYPVLCLTDYNRVKVEAANGVERELRTVFSPSM